MSRRRFLFWILALAASGYAALLTGVFAPAAPNVRPPVAVLDVPAPSAPNAPTLRILFIGNSLTYAGNLPAMIQGLARAPSGGDPQNTSVSPELATYEGMQLRIDRTYERLATLLQGTLVPAGAAWRAANGEGRGP